MLIYNDDYVLVFENKIDYIPNNPFREYESEVNIRFKAKKIKFYIFSQDECDTPKNWENKLINNIFSVIKNNLKFDYKNKWDIVVKDFLNHYLKEKKKMTKKELASVEKNLTKFMKARDYLNQFVDEITDYIYKKFDPQKINSSEWNNCIWRIIKPYEKREYPKIELCLDYGGFLLYISYDYKSGKNVTELTKIVGNKYTHWPAKKGEITVFGLKPELVFKNLEDTYRELGIQWNKMKKIYKIK
jgi:hypothetical protein